MMALARLLPVLLLGSILNVFAHDASAAEPLCSRDVMCIVPVQNGDSVDIYIQNRQSAEITVTLDAVLENMGADRSLPHTETYPGLASTKAFTVKARNKDQPWDYHYSYKWTWGSIHAEHDENVLYRLPYEAGRGFRDDQAFNGHFSHYGDFQYSIDFNMPKGTPIHAARAGVVVGVKDIYDQGGPHRDYENFCNYVMIKHDDGTVAEYDHLQYKGVKVKVGDRVNAGDFIALSGNTGFTTGPHLHFFVYKAVDGGKRQSFPIKFKLGESAQAEDVAVGRTYMAIN